MYKKRTTTPAWKQLIRKMNYIPAKNLNINALTNDAIDGLHALDKTFIGTKNYMGIAWFWNNEYKHYLRGDVKEITYLTRRRVHNAMLRAGLDVEGESEQHLAIVIRHCGIK
jgi:hypothetical protein